MDKKPSDDIKALRLALLELAEWADLTTRGDTTTQGRKVALAQILKKHPAILELHGAKIDGIE